MQIVISFIGDTDPIRNFHDGSALHVVRNYRPDKIILFYTQHTIAKKDDVTQAINAISDKYQPEIIHHEKLVDEEDPNIVSNFDQVFEITSQFINQYLNENDEYILNLSSGTPQMKSALFTYNMIQSLNMETVTVATPVGGSNAGYGHDNGENIEDLILTNEDNQENFISRIRVENPVNFRDSLVQRYLRQLIEGYNYYGAYEVLKEEKNIPHRAILLKELKETFEHMNYQTLPEPISKLKYSDELKKSLHALLILKIKINQGELAQVLVMNQSIFEYLLAMYINKHYPNLLLFRAGRFTLNAKKYPEVNQFLQLRSDEYLNFNKYWEIIQYYHHRNADHSVVLDLCKDVIKVRELRNIIAHNLNSLDPSLTNEIRAAYSASFKLIELVYKFDSKWLNYYDQKNEQLLSYL